jgi:hypothetical protein
MRGHGIELVQEPRVDKRIINETPPFRIGRDVFELSSVVLFVANPMLVEAGLPDFPGKLSAHLMGKAALDALGATLDGLVLGRGQQDV